MAAELVPLLRRPDVALDETGRRQVFEALDEFTRLMIGRTIVMGEALAGRLPESKR
jgi:hypothetical protein